MMICLVVQRSGDNRTLTILTPSGVVQTITTDRQVALPLEGSSDLVMIEDVTQHDDYTTMEATVPQGKSEDYR